ncbi:DUF177 domain-containing protein [Tessaracoccus sp. OH4464_COT-324]|uniref:YceD family protein n=1 Tax=Tessaracoccus sp. OH4464_COT-324 TaxID=2491059 RepID=UPI000F636A6B|nr:YceD family protein [Tessaracoccus sp. OH4464_COT-324]RRD46274.1 DUF177 domain-containing protein [Tessaracoccus sp. OH4464_COT-324]
MKSDHRAADRRSPLVFDVHEVGRRPGVMKEFEVTVPAPGELGSAVIGVPEGSPIQLHLKMESVVEGVLVSGRAAADIVGQCSRCLAELEDSASFEFQELFYYPGREIEDDESLIVDETVCIEEPLRGAVVLELPFTPLCDEDCLGLCPECGLDLNADPDHDHGARVDPRWAKLAGLTGDNE